MHHIITEKSGGLPLPKNREMECQGHRSKAWNQHWDPRSKQRVIFTRFFMQYQRVLCVGLKDTTGTSSTSMFRCRSEGGPESKVMSELS